MAKKEKDENALVETKAQLPVELLEDMEQYAAQNNVRDIESDEVITPRIALLQSGSPQVKKSTPDYVAGAEEGDIFNTGTKKVFKGDTGIVFVPCFHQRIFNEWIPKNNGGGLVKRWGEDDSFKAEGSGYFEDKGKWQSWETDEKGNRKVKTEIVKTADYYVLLIDQETGAFTPAVLGFSGTKYKVHRKLINDISLADMPKKDGTGVFTPPPFARVYRLTTIPESNADNSWFNYRWERLGGVETLKNYAAIVAAAKEFRKLVIDGVAKVADDIQDEGVTNDAETI